MAASLWARPLFPFAGRSVAVIGSRFYDRLDLVESFVIHTLLPHGADGTPLHTLWPRLIVSGGARGVDSCAAKAASKYNAPVKVIRPDFQRHGRGAPLERNWDIIDAADAVVAFWNEESRGTRHALGLAWSKHLSVLVFGADGTLRKRAV